MRDCKPGHLRMTAVIRPANRRVGSALRGFTLIEILIVLAVLVMLAGLAWPALEGQISTAQLPESASRLRDVCYMARVEAAKEHRRVRIRFEPGEQQPRIEIERDPILYPNEWEPVTSGWAELAMEGLLLSNVQVHSIKLGRPEWTKPLSLNDSPETGNENDNTSFNNDEVDALDTDEVPEHFDATAAQSDRGEDDVPIDEYRPVIEFAVDGSSDWALFELAQRLPEEEIEDGDTLKWVLLDGRNGLARVQEALTEEDLSDDLTYVIRENLYPPDLTDLGRLTLTSTGFGGQPATDEDGDGIPDAPLTDESGDGVTDGIDDGMGGDSGMDGDGKPETPSDLEDLLNNSDLSEAERNTIRNAMNGGGGRNGGRTGGGRGTRGNPGRNGSNGERGGGRDDTGGGRKNEGQRPERKPGN